MAAPTYDAAKHHIGLQELAGGTIFGFTLHGAYTKEFQREGIGAPDFGGATDLIGQAPSVSRWTQDDFVGGMYQWNWGRDDAMFADCKGFMPDPQGRSLISCPPMFLKHAFDSDAKSNFVSDVPKNMFMVAGSIYVVFGHGILRYEIGTDTETWDVGLLDVDGTETFLSAEYDSNDQIIWAATRDTTAGVLPRLLRLKTDLTDPVVAGVAGPPGTEGLIPTGFTMRDSNILLACGRKLFYGDPHDDPELTTTPVVVWTEVGRLPGKWADSIPYNGMTYILCNDGSYKSQICAYDGDGILPICTFPSSFYAKCMIEYAGRIFVGGTGTDVNGGELYAELYEVTGASVRSVRTFSPETRSTLLSSGNWPNTINDLVVHEGLLWLCQRGSKMVVYDVTSDGFFGAAEIQSNTDLDFYKMVGGRGRIWAYGVDATDDTKHGIYRIAQPADSVSAWTPTFTTSDFYYEPGVKKRWSEIKVMHRYGTMTSIEYSKDSGASWTALTVVDSGSGHVHYSTASLNAVAPSEHIRFRFTFDSTSALTYHKELIAYTVSFAFLDTGKRSWNLVINGSEEVEILSAELEEGTTEVQDVSAIALKLEGWMTAKTALKLTDVDHDAAEVFNVHIVGFRKQLPIIGPSVSGTTYREALYSLTLLEV